MNELDVRLTEDCADIGQFSLCKALLMKDANYPWVILVPLRDNITEIYELDELDQEQLIWESSFVARVMKELFNADKMNVAALGNIVPQLHIHHIARSEDDMAWPYPVWGRHPVKGYSKSDLADLVEKLRAAFVTSVFSPGK